MPHRLVGGDPSPEVVEVVRIARLAGAAIEAVRAKGFVARGKADHSPVTEADLAADGIIMQELARAFPRDALVSEESEDQAATRIEPGAGTWIVDPLDGTEAFIDPSVRGYAVQIGRVVTGEAVLGVVYEPVVGELFWAERGRGAWFVRGDEPARRLATRGETEGLRLVTSTRVRREFRQALFERGLADGGMFRSVGVKIGRVVQGLADVYPATHALSVWDVAAPLVVLEEAGGRMTDLEGRIPRFDLDPGASRQFDEPLLATNGPAHDHWCEVLRGLVPPRRGGARHG